MYATRECVKIRLTQQEKWLKLPENSLTISHQSYTLALPSGHKFNKTGMLRFSNGRVWLQ